MRIRKNTTLSSLLLAAGCGGERPQTHVCQFNQSPWDAIPFTSSDTELTNQLIDSSYFFPSSSSSSPRINLQFDGDDSFNGNASLGDSNGAAESAVSVEKLDLIVEDDNEKLPEEEAVNRSLWRKSNKGRKSKAHEPNSSKRTSGEQTSPPRRGRPRGSTKKSTAIPVAANSGNPYEFYYYSGFGPRWSKRRGGGGRNGAEEETVMSGKSNGDHEGGSRSREDKTASLGDREYDCNGLDYMEEDEEEDDVAVVDQDGDTVKTVKLMKRGRKPVKARSLKSLM